MKEEKIKVLALLPMELPKEIELDNTLEAMQKFVGGLIEYITLSDTGSEVTYASLCDRAGVNKDILKRAVGHTPKSKTLDEVYLHPKANQMIEAFDSANQLVKDEVLALPEE